MVEHYEYSTNHFIWQQKSPRVTLDTSKHPVGFVDIRCFLFCAILNRYFSPFLKKKKKWFSLFDFFPKNLSSMFFLSCLLVLFLFDYSHLAFYLSIPSCFLLIFLFVYFPVVCVLLNRSYFFLTFFPFCLPCSFSFTFCFLFFEYFEKIFLHPT